MTNGKNLKFSISYPESKEEEFCISGKALRKENFRFKKSIDLYSDQEITYIIDILKQQVSPSIAISFLNAGIINEKKKANSLLINSSLDEFLVIEKKSKNSFMVNGQVYSNIALKNKLVPLAKEQNVNKILIGNSTKTLFVYGDISNTFLPSVQNSNLVLYRTGKDNELIEIK